MEGTVLSAAEAVEYGEFKRTRREAEIAVVLRKVIVDASRREIDRTALKTACESVKKLNAHGVLASPLGVASAKKNLAGSGAVVACLVGGTGESLIPVKKLETKKAVAQGAREVRLVLSYSALRSKNASYLRREVKKVRRAVKKNALIVSLEDSLLSEDDVAMGARAAMEGGADAVCVRGEVSLVLRALRAVNGKLRVDVSAVENAEQLRELMKSGAALCQTTTPEKIAKELYDAAREQSERIATVAISEVASDQAPISSPEELF